ncbi:MAG: 2,3-diphosphoglycerate synthetase, partial [Methanobacteriales archaeon]|nr:2,3-diphosphoglycerate synthetase [Methanobacteriales archaeon]
DIEDKSVLFATTAPRSVMDTLVTYIEDKYNCNIVGTTNHLSNRPLLQKDIEKYIDEAEVMLTELKAAAVDVATKEALDAGLDVVYSDNIPIVVDESPEDLDKAIIEVVDAAIDDFYTKLTP